MCIRKYVYVSVCVYVCLTLDIARKTKRNERKHFYFTAKIFTMRRAKIQGAAASAVASASASARAGDGRRVWRSIAWHYLRAARQREARSYSKAVAADGRTTSSRTLH